MRENGKNWKANEQATLGTGVIKLRQESERKALPLWTHNTLQALITDMDKQMSRYHSQQTWFILTGDRKKPFSTQSSKIIHSFLAEDADVANKEPRASWTKLACFALSDGRITFSDTFSDTYELRRPDYLVQIKCACLQHF